MLSVERFSTILQTYEPSFRDVGEVFLSHLEQSILPHTVLVDVGCGRETFGKEIYARAARRIGIDKDVYARENTCMDTVYIISDDHMPLEDATIDVVTAQWTVEHVQDPFVFLSEIARILKPGGRFIFMTTNIRAPFVWVTSHLPVALKRLLRARVLGFEEDETFPTFYALNTPACIERMAAAQGFRVHAREEIESYGYFRFSRVALLAYIFLIKIQRRITHGRAMHLVYVLEKI